MKKVIKRLQNGRIHVYILPAYAVFYALHDGDAQNAEICPQTFIFERFLIIFDVFYDYVHMCFKKTIFVYECFWMLFHMVFGSCTIIYEFCMI